MPSLSLPLPDFLVRWTFLYPLVAVALPISAAAKTLDDVFIKRVYEDESRRGEKGEEKKPDEAGKDDVPRLLQLAESKPSLPPQPAGPPAFIELRLIDDTGENKELVLPDDDEMGEDNIGWLDVEEGDDEWDASGGNSRFNSYIRHIPSTNTSPSGTIPAQWRNPNAPTHVRDIFKHFEAEAEAEAAALEKASDVESIGQDEDAAEEEVGEPQVVEVKPHHRSSSLSSTSASSTATFSTAKSFDGEQASIPPFSPSALFPYETQNGQDDKDRVSTILSKHQPPSSFHSQVQSRSKAATPLAPALPEIPSNPGLAYGNPLAEMMPSADFDIGTGASYFVTTAETKKGDGSSESGLMTPKASPPKLSSGKILGGPRADSKTGESTIEPSFGLPSPPLSPPSAQDSLLSITSPIREPPIIPPPSIAFASATIESLSPYEPVLSELEILGLGHAMPPVGEGRVVRDVKIEWKPEEEVWGMKDPFGRNRDAAGRAGDGSVVPGGESEAEKESRSEGASDVGSNRTVSAELHPSSSVSAVLVSSASKPEPASASPIDRLTLLTPTPTHLPIPPPLLGRVTTPVVHLQNPFESTVVERKSRSEVVTPTQSTLSSAIPPTTAEEGDSSFGSTANAAECRERERSDSGGSSGGGERFGSFRVDREGEGKDGMGMDLSVDDLELVGEGEVGAMRVKSVAERKGLKKDRPISISSTNGDLGSPVLPYFLPSSRSSSVNDDVARNGVDLLQVPGSVHSISALDESGEITNSAVSTLRLDESPWREQERVGARAVSTAGEVGEEETDEGGRAGIESLMGRWKGEDVVEVEMDIADGEGEDGEPTPKSEQKGRLVVAGEVGEVGDTPGPRDSAAGTIPDVLRTSLTITAPIPSPSPGYDKGTAATQSSSPLTHLSPISTAYSNIRPATADPDESAIDPSSPAVSTSSHQDQHDQSLTSAGEGKLTKTQKNNAKRRAKAKEQKRAREASGGSA